MGKESRDYLDKEEECKEY